MFTLLYWLIRITVVFEGVRYLVYLFTLCVISRIPVTKPQKAAFLPVEVKNRTRLKIADLNIEFVHTQCKNFYVSLCVHALL